MNIYKKSFIKKLGLLFCICLIICTFIKVNAATNDEVNSVSEVLPALQENVYATAKYPDDKQDEIQNDMLDRTINSPEKEIDGDIFEEVLVQQNAEKKYEKKSNVVPTMGGLVIRKRDSIDVSKEERNILYRIVEAEAGSENISGKMLVANVIINRYLDKSFPNSIKGVVFAHDAHTYQFSPISDGRYYTVKVSKQTKEAVNNALKGLDNSKGALYFMCRDKSDSSNVSWFDNSLDYVLKYGCHEFFR